MTEVLGFLVHYWLFTTATLACLWVIAVNFLRHTASGSVGRNLARRDNKRKQDYREAVAQESAELNPHEGDVAAP